MTKIKHETTSPSTACPACREWQRDMNGTLSGLERERQAKAKLLEALNSLLKATAPYARHFEEYKYALAAMTEATDESIGRAVRAPNVASVKLTSVAAIRAACELTIAQGTKHAEVMYKSDNFEDDDYVGADLEEFTEAVNDPDELEEYCGGGRQSWEMWVYEWPEDEKQDAASGEVAA